MEATWANLIFSQTNTGMGACIRLVTGQFYNHVALHFSQNPQAFYSFARRYCNAPLWGGFVEESPQRYLKTGKDCHVKACALPQEMAQLAWERLQPFLQAPQWYLYNSYDALYTLWGKRYPLPGAFTCVGFVENLLQAPALGSIPGLEAAFAQQEVYQGSFMGYLQHWGLEGPKTKDALDTYFTRLPFFQAVRGTIGHLEGLHGRKRLRK